MGRLVTDPFVRGIAQAVVITAISLLMVICLLVDLAIVFKYHGLLEVLKPTALFAFAVLALPFKELAGQLIVVFGSIIPVVLATVCFKTDNTTSPPTPTAEFNKVGRFVVIVMLIGLLVGFIALALLHSYSVVAEELSSSLDAKERTVDAIAAIVAFQAIYFAQLMGLKPK